MQKIKYRVPNDGQRHRISQSFDKEKIFVIRCGKKINVYDEIQANAVDTDLYKTLEKYGSIDSLMKHDKQEIQTDFEELNSLMDLHEHAQKADEMWKGLPAGVREIFKNDKMNFLQNGEQWLKDSMKPQPKPQTEPKPETKEDK